jgi:hypothetical protein
MIEKDFEDYNLEDYPEVKEIEFPKEIYIAYAVCGKSCENKEFIADGQSQICQYCRKSMFRTEVKRYILANDEVGCRNEE